MRRSKEDPISRTAHLAFALAYSVVALLLMAAAMPAFGPAAGLALGGFAFLLGALAHEAVARRRNDLQFLRRMAALRRISVDLQDQLDRSRQEARRVHEALEAAGGAKSNPRRSVDVVVAEVRLLQTLVARLSGRGETAAAGGTGGLAVAAIGPASAPRAGVGHGPAPSLDPVCDGLRRDRVDLYLQPIVSLPQRKRRFFECYTRVRDANGAAIEPARCLEDAAREGLIEAIDNMLLFRCVQLIRGSEKRNTNAGFFCNVSGHSLGDQAFLDDFVAFMGANADLAACLFFQLAQADLAAHETAARGALQRLGELGFRFAIDRIADLDLNVTSLASRHFRFVKVEADLLLPKIRREPPADEVRDFKALLDQAGIDLIVDGIEGEAELVDLLDYNVDYGQGALFGEPRAARET